MKNVYLPDTKYDQLLEALSRAAGDAEGIMLALGEVGGIWPASVIPQPPCQEYGTPAH